MWRTARHNILKNQVIWYAKKRASIECRNNHIWKGKENIWFLARNNCENQCKLQKKKWRSIVYAAKYESRNNLNFLQAASVLSHKSPESFIEMQWTNTCIDWLEHMSPHMAIRNDCCLAVCGLWNKCSQSITGCCHRLWSVDRNSLVIDYVVDCTLWFFLHISSNNEAHYWFSERHY